MSDKPGFNHTEYEAMQMRLEKLLEDPDVTSLKVKLVYQERHRPGRYEGREYKILEDE